VGSVLRKRVLVYAAAGLLLAATVWALAWWSVARESESRIIESARQAERLALYFERHALSIFRYGDAYVKMLRREFVRTGGSVDAVRDTMRDVRLDRSLVSHVTILDSVGTPIFNSGYDIKPGVGAGDRDYFLSARDHAAPESDPLQVSLPHRGRNSEKLIVRLVRRIDSPDGRFLGVIFAALDAEGVTAFFRAMNLGPNSSATLVGLDKRIRARSSYGRLGPGQDISGSRIWRELERSPTGLYLQTSVVDQVTRYYAYRRLEEYPLVVAIGVASDDITRVVAGYRFPAYLIALLATVVIASVTALLSRETLAADRLRASEARVRTMRDELEVRVEERTAELATIQDTLLRKERLAVLGQLTGTVAHELRNPLSTIDTSLAVLERRLDMSAGEIERLVERIHRNVARCNDIITELLDFARTRSARLAPTALDPWLSDVGAELAAACPVPLRVATQAGDAMVAIDRDRLRRALINLVDNARDAVASAGRADREIRVATRVTGTRAEIEVSDDGPGIAPDLMARIREPLYSTKSFGIGLGLSIVEQIMDEHGGGLELVSEEGAGTRALLWLPLASANG